MTTLIWICIGIFIGFMLGIFTGALMCIKKVSDAQWEHAKLHDEHLKLVDRHLKMKKEYQDYIQGVEHG